LAGPPLQDQFVRCIVQCLTASNWISRSAFQHLSARRQLTLVFGSQAALINLDTFSNAGELLARSDPGKTFRRCQVLTSRQDVYINQDTDQDFRFFQVPALSMSTFVNMQADSLQASTFSNTPGSEVRSLVRTLYARSDCGKIFTPTFPYLPHARIGRKTNRPQPSRADTCA
jgi:hypothetical protein